MLVLFGLVCMAATEAVRSKSSTPSTQQGAVRHFLCGNKDSEPLKESGGNHALRIESKPIHCLRTDTLLRSNTSFQNFTDSVYRAGCAGATVTFLKIFVNVQLWTNQMLTRKYESEHAKSKNTIRGGQTTARYLCVKKAPFSHVVTVIRPRVSLTGMERNLAICMF